MFSCGDCLLHVRSDRFCYNLHRFIDQFHRIFGFRSFGDDADDGFGVAGADLDPAVGPVESQPVTVAGFCVGEGFSQSFTGCRNRIRRAGDLVFDDGVEW